jgi:hypothetical protein
MLDWYIGFVIQPLQGCQRVFLSLPWVAPTVIQIQPPAERGRLFGVDTSIQIRKSLFRILLIIAAFGFMRSLFRNRFRYNSLRYAGRDYSLPGKYFVTICTAQKTVNNTMSSISPKSGSLSVVVRSYKSAVTKHAHKFDNNYAWQSNFYDNIICTAGQLKRIRKYVSDNPKHWKGNK